MLRLRYSDDQLDLEGSRSDLRQLAAQITAFANSREKTLHVAADKNFDPTPYQHALRRLFLEKSEGSIDGRAVDGEFHISGRPDLLLWFAQSLPHSAEQPNSHIRYHVHFDSSSWPEDIAADSAEMILSLR